MENDILYWSGDAFMPRYIIDKLDTLVIGDDDTIFYINYWHFVHMFTGVIFSYFFFKYSLITIVIHYVILHTLWEIWQFSIGMTPATLRGLSDTIIDTLFGVAGVLAIYYSMK
jgi:hypothetical protein